MDGPELQEFIDRYNAAWNAHDVDAIVSMHTEDSVFENHVTGDVNVGREAIGRAITGIFSVFPDLAFETRRAYVREDLVVQEWTATGTHEGTMTRSGIEVRRPAARSTTRAWTSSRSATAWSRGRTSTRTRSRCCGSSG